MTTAKIETKIINDLNFGSEDRSRDVGRGHRLLTIVAAGFVFLALCLMFVDFQRLDHLTPRHPSPYRQTMRPVKMVGRISHL